MCEYLKVSVDEGIREGTSLEKLAKLKPAFQADGSTTAGGCFISNFLTRMNLVLLCIMSMFSHFIDENNKNG